MEKLQGIVHEMHARAEPTSSDNAFKAVPSLNRGSLASVKSLGHAAEIEVDNVLRTAKSADFGARGGSGNTPDVVDPAAVVLERGAGLALNGCDSEGVCTGAKNFAQHDIVVVLILLIVAVHAMHDGWHREESGFLQAQRQKGVGRRWPRRYLSGMLWTRLCAASGAPARWPAGRNTLSP